MTSIAAILDDSGSIQGQVQHLASTDDSKLELQGSANPGETVRIYQNGGVIGETTADSNGNWSYTASQLREGSYSFTATAIDSNGQESLPSSEHVVNVDQTAVIAKSIQFKGATGLLDNGDSISNGLVEISGLAEANARVDIYDQGNKIASVQADAQGQWNIELDLPAGAHDISTIVVDQAGNESAESMSINLNVDASQLQHASASPANSSGNSGPDEVVLPPGTIIKDGGFTNDNTPQIQGTATPGASVTLTVNGKTYGPVTSSPTGQWSIQTAEVLPEGKAIFKARAVDKDGKEDFSGYSLTIDTEASAPPVISHGDDDVGLYQGELHHPAITDDDTITFHGTGTAGEIISIYNGNVFLGATVVKSDDSWEFRPTKSFLEGTHNIAAYSRDAAGNTSEKSNDFQITVDRSVEAPEITHLIDDQGSKTDDVKHGEATDDQQPVIVGTAEPGATVSVTIDGQLLPAVTADDKGVWSIQLTSDLDEGDHSINATQLDLAGNQSGESENFEFEIVLNAEPVANDDSYTVIKSSKFDVLANDTDPDNDSLTLTRIVSQGNHGSARITKSGELIYTPDGNNTQTVNDTLVYEISDGRGGFDTATVNIEVLAPLIKPTIDLKASSDSGKFDNDNLTNDTTPTFTGDATAGSTVVLYADNKKVGETTANNNGKWTITSTDLVDKIYDFHVESSLGGSSKNSADLAVEIDTIVEASAQLPSAQENGSWFGSAASVRFQISANEEVSYHIKDVGFHWGSRVWYNPGTSITATGTTSSDITVAAKYTSTYSHGWFTFNAAFTDLAGNELDMDLTPVVVDPITALADGGYLVTYLKLSDTEGQGFDVFAQRYDAEGNSTGDSFMVNSFKPGDQINSDVIGLKDGGFVVTWQSRDQDGDLDGIYAQRYDADNNLVGPETQINVYTDSDQQRPAVSDLADGGYVITWMSDGQDGSGEGIYMRLFNAEGVAITGDVRVNDSVIDNQANPSITTLSDGRLIVSWDTENSAGQTQAMAKIYDAQGRSQSGEFTLSSDGGAQSLSHVSATANGGFAVSWLEQAGEHTAVKVQLFNSDGTTSLSSAIDVHSSISAGASKPEVAGLANGDIVVTWTADDGEQLGVFASRYNANGEVVYENKLINREESGVQTEPHIVALNDGGYLITWGDLQAEEGRSSVWGQQFNADNSATGPAFEVGEVANYGNEATTSSNEELIPNAVEDQGESQASSGGDSVQGSEQDSDVDNDLILPPDTDALLSSGGVLTDGQDLALNYSTEALLFNVDLDSLSSVDFNDLLIDSNLGLNDGVVLGDTQSANDLSADQANYFDGSLELNDLLSLANNQYLIDII
ncbi:Ig-like domain-containing protein [uncultured Pseudoteredinibacter sp.]|uniref:Ig-like domain-containing protein n=1 Tax=uncultured Pseudoteredinibacter sp. TaxID=1641701 RepID=UPI002638438E|nr:Ig-like domain-containing protein [uncultured Pseudoteredinibacter sp.]